MCGFDTNDISHRGEAVECFVNCTGQPSPSPPPGPGGSHLTPLFISDLDDDFEVCYSISTDATFSLLYLSVA